MDISVRRDRTAVFRESALILPPVGVVVRPASVFHHRNRLLACSASDVTMQVTPVSIQRNILMNSRVKVATLNLRISPELKAAAEKAAAADHRSLTSLIEKLLSEHLQKHGYMKSPAKK
jgi:hypothetical protein